MFLRLTKIAEPQNTRNDHDRIPSPVFPSQTRSTSPAHSHVPRKQSPLATPPLRPESPAESQSQPEPEMPPSNTLDLGHLPQTTFQQPQKRAPSNLSHSRPKPRPIDSSAASWYLLCFEPDTGLTCLDELGVFSETSNPPAMAVQLAPSSTSVEEPSIHPSIQSATLQSKSSRPSSPNGKAGSGALLRPYQIKRNQSSPGPQSRLDPQARSGTNTSLSPNFNFPATNASRNDPYSQTRRANTTPLISQPKSRKHGGSQEKLGIVGLFRRKSSKSLSKRDISSPGSRPAENIPSMPSLTVAKLSAGADNESQDSPVKLDLHGQPLPSGPAPPRPARPDAVDLPGNLQISEVLSVPHPLNVETTPSPTTRPDPKAEKESKLAAARNSDALVYLNTVSTSPERLQSSSGAGLPQIIEDDDIGDSHETKHPPPSAWPSGRLRSLSRGDSSARPTLELLPPLPRLATSQDQMNLNSQHTPSESLSSDGGSRFGFDGRTDSSVSSPPTSNASSLSQWKPSLEDQIAQLDQGSEPFQHGQHPRRAANFSRPRLTEPASPVLADTRPTNLPNLDSPTDPAIQNGRIAHEVVDSTMETPDSPSVQSPDSTSPLSISKHEDPLHRPERWPPVSTTPEFPLDLNRRPSLVRRKTSNTPKGPCKGCGLTITGRSVKAADGRLTGRYHRECE